MPQAAATAKAKDGCQLSYRIFANPQKPRVALIHSLALSGAMWEQVIDQLSPAAEILAYDCRGHGNRSAAPAPIASSFLPTTSPRCSTPAAGPP